MPRPRAHPRSHGEHGAREGAEGALPGSSPLARGTYELRPEVGVCRRLIPARAGNIFTTRPIDCLPSAHPRSRGEHTDLNHIQTDNAGSSPLARGALCVSTHAECRLGLIPARAGSTDPETDSAQKHAAHPRSRGEHWARDESPIGLIRLIPAHAGSTASKSTPNPKAPAHPRSRGEHRGFFSRQSIQSGSSPLTRRTQPLPHQQRLRRRLIPTNVGNTDSPGRTVPAGSVHPRSRGEY